METTRGLGVLVFWDKLVMQISYFLLFIFYSISPLKFGACISSCLASLFFFVSLSLSNFVFVTVFSPNYLSWLVYPVSAIVNYVVVNCVIDTAEKHAASIFKFEMRRQKKRLSCLDRRYFDPWAEGASAPVGAQYGRRKCNVTRQLFEGPLRAFRHCRTCSSDCQQHISLPHCAKISIQ